MSVVKIRVVRMRVRQWGMVVRVAVWLGSIPRKVMPVLVVRIVTMTVVVVQVFMCVWVFVPLGNVQPHAYGHECAGHPEDKSGRLTQQQER